MIEVERFEVIAEKAKEVFALVASKSAKRGVYDASNRTHADVRERPITGETSLSEIIKAMELPTTGSVKE